jgi:protein-S-isoprenylcysteine O-methyltransferase Ste14
MNTKHPVQFLLKLVCLIIIIMLWSWQADHAFSLAASLGLLIGSVLLYFPLCCLGRKLLDARPTADRAAQVNLIIHFPLVFLLGIAIVEAFKIGLRHAALSIPGDWLIPLPAQVGLVLFVVTGAVGVSAVVTLALRGLGAPFAIALSQRLALDWLYAWTRNPMVLGTLFALVSMGLMFRSLFLVLWALLVASALIFMLKVYEERELELRFGDSYRAYKRRTPFLWPRKPQAIQGHNQ